MITTEKFDDNSVKLETSQKKSLVSPAHQTGVPVSSVHSSKTMLHLCLNKTTVVCKLDSEHCYARLHFVTGTLKGCKLKKHIPHLLCLLMKLNFISVDM